MRRLHGLKALVVIAAIAILVIVAGIAAALLFKKGNEVHFSENFQNPIVAEDGKSFGMEDFLTFELFRNGTFQIDGKSGNAKQVSKSYRDSAWIRSTKALPSEYKITVLAGEIDYGLERISGIQNDPEYSEGPKKQNGCYLIAITDTS